MRDFTNGQVEPLHPLIVNLPCSTWEVLVSHLFVTLVYRRGLSDMFLFQGRYWWWFLVIQETSNWNGYTFLFLSHHQSDIRKKKDADNCKNAEYPPGWWINLPIVCRMHHFNMITYTSCKHAYWSIQFTNSCHYQNGFDELSRNKTCIVNSRNFVSSLSAGKRSGLGWVE